MGKLTKIDQLKADYPDEPWRWKEEWNEGKIQGGSKLEAMLLGGMALVFMGLSAPAVWAIPAEVKRGNHAILVVLLFWLLGGWLLWVAAKRARQWWKFGPLVFRPEPLPGSWGGYVGGVISIPKGASLTGDVILQLRNLRLVRSGSGKTRRLSETVQWETEVVLARSKIVTGDLLRDLPVLFHVPRAKGSPADETDARNRVVWKLSVKIPVRELNVPLSANWEIPVFDRGEDLPPPDEGEGLLDSEKVRPIDELMTRAGVVETRERGERVWRFRQPRVWKSGVFLGAFALTFGIVAWFVPVMLIKVGFGAFVVLLLALIPGIIWHRSELRLTPGEVEVVRATWRGVKRWRIKRADIGDITVKESMRSGELRYLRMSLRGQLGVEVTEPHPCEHFRARKVRYRWNREMKQLGRPSAEANKARLETPRFELRIAEYLKGTHEAERVRDYLWEQLTGD